jgi:hypothetical protein
MPPKRKPPAKGRPDDVFVHEPSGDLDDGSWPVTHTEDFHSQDVILAPGPTLQQCSGADVMLSKGASLKPNVAKGKGRFLIVLPGTLSIKAQKKDSKLPDADVAAADTVIDPTQDTEVSSCSPEEPASDALAVEAAKPNPKHVFGTISGLTTDTPKLTITLPNSQQLIFMGRKMETSSRFMMLSCHARKSTVMCKDSVQSLIVFGTATLSETTVSSTSVELPPGSPADQDAPFRHYGGSMRAFDGGKPGHKSLSRVVERTPKAADDMLLPEEESDEEEIPDGGHDSDDYVQVIKSSMEPKVRSRRSSSEKKITYTQESEEDVESEDNGESDEPNARPKKRSSPSGGRKQAAGIEEVDKQEKKPSKKKPTRKTVDVAATVKPMASEDKEDDDIEEDQEKETPRLSKSAPKAKRSMDDDDESFDGGVSIQNPAPRRRAPRRSTATPKNAVIELTGEGESEEDIAPPKKPLRKKRIAKAAPSKSKTFELGEDDDDELDEVKAPPTKKRRPAKTSVENDGDISVNEVVVPIDDESKQRKKPAPRKGRSLQKNLDNNKGRNDGDDNDHDFHDDAKEKAPVKRKPPAKTGGEPKKTPVRRKILTKTAMPKEPSAYGSKRLPIDVLDEFDVSSPAKTSSAKKIASPSPRTKSGRRKMHMSLAEAVVEVDDRDDWKLDE